MCKFERLAQMADFYCQLNRGRFHWLLSRKNRSVNSTERGNVLFFQNILLWTYNGANSFPHHLLAGLGYRKTKIAIGRCWREPKVLWGRTLWPLTLLILFWSQLFASFNRFQMEFKCWLFFGYRKQTSYDICTKKHSSSPLKSILWISRQASKRDRCYFLSS